MALPVKARPGAAAASKKGTAAPAAVKETEELGFVEVTRTYKEGGVVTSEEKDAETIQVRRFVGPVAHVSIQAKHTKSLGEMEFVQVGCMVSLPGYAEEVDEIAAAASVKCAEILGAELEALGDTTEKGEALETAGGEDTAAGDAEVVIGEDEIKAMKRPQLEALIEQNAELSAEIDLAEYPKTPPGLKKLQAKIIELAMASADGGTADAGEGYTQETLEAATEPELKELYKLWDMGDFPKGPEAKRKAAAIKAILEVQEAAAA